MPAKGSKYLSDARASIAREVRQLRSERRWTQKELAEKIELSQARLSEIERGGGSFTAEQLLLLSQLFNVPVSRFGPVNRSSAEHEELQNALARLGAVHLQERDDVLPSERFEQVARVVKETLVVGESRLLTAVAPVLVQHIDRLSLPLLEAELRDLGLDRRLPWLAENVLEAVRGEHKRSLPRDLVARYRRVEAVLDLYVETARKRSPAPGEPVDVLDATIRSKRTLEQVREHGSAISRQWGIVTGLQPADFAVALEAARAGA